jgi:SAM-dependent methyltransferase
VPDSDDSGDRPDAAASGSPDADSLQRYLAAKTTVDDRALHRPTEDRLRRELAALADHGDDGDAPDATDHDGSDDTDRNDTDDPCRVLEVGAGVGATLTRLLDRDCLPASVDYTLLDADPANLDAARDRIATWAEEHGATQRGGLPSEDGALRLSHDGTTVTVRFVAADAFAFVAKRPPDAYDLLVAQAFLDLFDLDEALPPLLRVVAPGGLVYAPITFDGESVFEPTPADLPDDAVRAAYHATMDAPDRGGSATAGRQLLTALPAHGASLLAAGASDWVVHPDPDGGYPADEASFCHHILDTVASAVGSVLDGDRAVEAPGGLTHDGLDRWVETRRRQVERGELVYVAHGYDVLARVETRGAE